MSHLSRAPPSRGPGALWPRRLPRLPSFQAAAPVPHVPGRDRIGNPGPLHGLNLVGCATHLAGFGGLLLVRGLQPTDDDKERCCVLHG